jgi:hypothetical protein
LITTINDKDVGINNVSTLLRKLAFIFRYDNRKSADHHFQIEANELDPVAALIIFKFFEYNSKNNCLLQPSANLGVLLDLLSKYGIEKIFRKLVNESQVEILYKKLQPIEKDGFFIAPHPINRDNFSSRKELETKYTQFISNYYEKICPDLVQYFNTCICEIASNFLYHAVEDENSILMAQGDETKIEIVCVDNSSGIISNLSPKSKNHRNTMMNAFKRGYSSKKDTGHCGTGLWYVQKITECLNGTFRVYSEDMSYICKSGKVFVKKSPYWKGSIFYLKLNVTDSSKINKFLNNFIEDSPLGLVSNKV